ncbi:hypothetical protein 015DV002_254 [Bacillus phage 015DV002]|nr:hypothetical protein 015DV002_6 [Bacillus phage 015DV002]QQO41208.1 hypothetical protein 015DV002_254 [Bacillus phage 015DV002]
MFTVKSDEGYLKLNTPTDYNENSYFVGFSDKPETTFSNGYKAETIAKLCGLTNFKVQKKGSGYNE